LAPWYQRRHAKHHAPRRHLAAAGSSCITDPNGAQCGIVDSRHGLDGDAYCPDPDVKKKCEALPEAFIDGFTACAPDGEEPDTSAAETAAKAAFPCDNAVAMTKTYDDCKKALEDPKCDGAEPEIPESCKTVVVPKV
jgi:hypothetical protein